MTTETVEILAPGKLFLMGEYAVRHNSPGVVMAVDRLVHLRWLSETDDVREDMVSQARSYTAQLLRLGRPSPCSVDSSVFYHEGDKLGLGSSAAVCAVSVASVFYEAGFDISSDEQRKKMWAIAKDVHDGFQGVSGSGLDLAASIFGGFVAMDKRRKADDGIFYSWKIPEELVLVFCWTASPSSTSSLVDAIDRWSLAHMDRHMEISSEMKEVSQGFCHGHPDVHQAMEAMDRYGQLMDRLGQQSGVPIFTDLMKELRVRAQEFGGVVKPSGAGGGDFVLAGFDDPAAGVEFADAARRLGTLPMEFGLCGEGVHAMDGKQASEH